MPYIVYAYIAPAAVLLRSVPPHVGPMPGVLWFISTPAQTFKDYQVWYCQQGIMGLVLPAPQMRYMCLAKDMFPGITNASDLIVYAGCAMEVWAGTNAAYAAIDVYHRYIIKDIASPNVFSHYVVTGAGTEPCDWYWATQAYCMGQYAVEGVTLIRSARL